MREIGREMPITLIISPLNATEQDQCAAVAMNHSHVKRSCLTVQITTLPFVAIMEAAHAPCVVKLEIVLSPGDGLNFSGADFRADFELISKPFFKPFSSSCFSTCFSSCFFRLVLNVHY